MPHTCHMTWHCTKWLQYIATINLAQGHSLTEWYHVVPGTCRGGSFEKETWFIGIHGELERSDLKWNAWNGWIDMNHLKWGSWNAWIETHELKRMKCHEWIEMKELTWRNWDAWLETHELTWMKWNEWIDVSELKWVTCHGWLEMKELKRMNWTEWMKWNEFKQMNRHEIIETNELKRMNWHEWFVGLILKKWSEPISFLRFLCDQLLDDDVVDRWNGALATVSCTFCRPHLQIVVRTRQLRYSLVRILWTTFSDRGAHPRKQGPSSGDHGRPLYAKKTQGFAPQSLFSREFTRSRSLTLPNHLMVMMMMMMMMVIMVIMMMWLTRWCGWHDDWDDDVAAMMVRQLAIDNRP